MLILIPRAISSGALDLSKQTDIILLEMTLAEPDSPF
jgi:hypothetical protein